MLDDLDRELERRGLRFVRYADDCNIYVRSRRAGERVMQSITRFLTGKLKLKVNEAKSAVARPAERKFLGFSFTSGKQPKRRIAPKTLLAVQEASPGTDQTEPGRQPGANGRTASPLPDGLARLLRLLPDAIGASRPGLVDTAATPLLPVEAVETRAKPASRNSANGAWARTWRPKPPAARADCGTSAAVLP